MKKYLILICISSLAMLSKPGYAQTEIDHYVVIGAFSKHNNAIKWTDQANKLNFSAQYAINTSRQLYYVYILKTADKKKAFSFLLKIRVETKYKDAWVYSGALGKEVIEVPVTPDPVVVEKPVVEEKPAIEVVEEVVEKEIVVEPDPVVEEVVEKPKGKAFLFKLVSSNEEVLGEIHVLESARASQYQAFKGNEIIYMNSPKNTEGAFIAAVQAPGYRPVQLTVDFSDPSVLSSGIGPQGEVIIPIELVRSRRGDYIEFNNVKFFGNSAIFQPDSKIELDALADLMKDQPKYKIEVHGHCNGKQSRNIVSKGSSNEFFETSTLNTRGIVSAKELTQLRADLVKEYLISQGIEAKRIKTKAEGGKVMIYPQGGTLSGYNDRIEVEIKSGK